MITAFLNAELHCINYQNLALLNQAVWIDIQCPTSVEEAQVEKNLKLDIPTRDEMREIEFSSRLYQDDGALYMTAIMIAHSDSPEPVSDAVTFIFTQKQLITIRYIEPQAFKLFLSRLNKMTATLTRPIDFFVEILDTTVDRLADILELAGHRLDDASKLIFQSKSTHNEENKLNYKKLLQQIGAAGDLNGKARESLITFNRLLTFFQQLIDSKLGEEFQSRFNTLTKDINSLSHHADFLSNKVSFLLDATLGMVNIEQNNTIKIVSVAAVIFLPPTLIASIYGMNFKLMPELAWYWGYPMAIGLMILAAWLPYKYFKRRKWL